MNSSVEVVWVLSAVFLTIGTVSFFLRKQMQRFELDRRNQSGGGSEVFKPHNRIFIAFRVVPFWMAAIVCAVIALTAR